MHVQVSGRSRIRDGHFTQVHVVHGRLGDGDEWNARRRGGATTSRGAGRRTKGSRGRSRAAADLDGCAQTVRKMDGVGGGGGWW